MRPALLLVLLLAFAPAAAAQETNATNETNETGGEGNETPTDPSAPPAPVAITLIGSQAGNAFFWLLEGETQRNPVLTVPPGAEVTVTVKSEIGFHNLRVTGFPASEFVSDGETTTYTFTAPSEPTTLEYWCDPHRAAGMKGTLRVQAGGAPDVGGGAPGGGSGPDVSGESVDLATLGYPECAGFTIPAATARGEVGGPTVADYVAKCRAGDAPVVTQREKHAADYVIPASWALIALGIVGVVWVHRSYKP